MILDCRVFTIAQIPRGGGGFGDVISHDGPHSLSNDTSSLSYTMIVSFQEGGQKSARNSVSFAQGMVKYMSSHSRHIAPQQLIHAVRRENLAASVSVQGMKHHSIFETSLPDQNFHMRVKQLQDGSGCLEVAGGPEHGFRPGQLVHLALGGRRLGQAKVQRTQSGTTILADVTGLDTKDVQFVEVIPPGHILKVFNAAGYSIPEPGPFDWYEVVSDESDADMILRKASSGQLSIVPHDRLFHRYDATFLPLKNVEARLLNRISRFRTILHLPHSTLYNDISPLPTSGCLELELFPLAWDAQGAFLEPSTASLFRDGYSTNITLSNPDQCYGLKITQNYGADMYLYLLAFNTADFTVTVRTSAIRPMRLLLTFFRPATPITSVVSRSMNPLPLVMVGEAGTQSTSMLILPFQKKLFSSKFWARRSGLTPQYGQKKPSLEPSIPEAQTLTMPYFLHEIYHPVSPLQRSSLMSRCSTDVSTQMEAKHTTVRNPVGMVVASFDTYNIETKLGGLWNELYPT